MRIAYISNSTIPSFTANSINVMKMCQAMVQEGHHTTLYARQGDSTLARMEDQLWQHYGVSHTFPIRRLCPRRIWHGYDFALQTFREARCNGAELIYTRHMATAALCSQFGFPTILELHDFPSGKIAPWLLKLFLRGSGFIRLVSISHSLRKVIHARFTISRQERKSIVAPDGVDLERFDKLMAPNEARCRLGLSDMFSVGYSGSLYAGRGVELILNLAQEMPNIQFILLGAPPRKTDTSITQMLQLELPNVHLMGYVPNANVPTYLSACEILLMPYQYRVSVSNGGNTVNYMSPLKLFEYMAMERLIISSDLVVLREVLNEQNAIFCPPEDLTAWISAIGEGRNHPHWREKLARQARSDASRYTWIQRVQNCLSEVC